MNQPQKRLIATCQNRNGEINLLNLKALAATNLTTSARSRRKTLSARMRTLTSADTRLA
jgi:hypothetical protein